MAYRECSNVLCSFIRRFDDVLMRLKMLPKIGTYFFESHESLSSEACKSLWASKVQSWEQDG